MTTSPDVPSTCRGCGAPVTFATDEDTGDTVMLEKHTEPSGDRRYRVVQIGPPLKVKRVSEQSAIDAYPDHKLDCPAGDNGLPR